MGRQEQQQCLCLQPAAGCSSGGSGIRFRCLHIQQNVSALYLEQTPTHSPGLSKVLAREHAKPEKDRLDTLVEDVEALVGGRRSHVVGAGLVLQLSGLLRLQSLHRARIVEAKVSKVQASRLPKLQPLICGVVGLRISHSRS